MFLVTNRKILRASGDTNILGSKPNEEGPNELRIVEAHKRSTGWQLRVLPDQVTKDMQAEVDAPDRHVVSYTTCKLIDRVNPRLMHSSSRKKGRNLLIFVHGFNNDVEDVLERSRLLARNYGVEVLPFTWPANGGGAIGTVSYKSDKRDAKASTGALDRVLAAIGDRLGRIAAETTENIHREAAERFPDNQERCQAFIARKADAGCPFTVNLMAHSMGNYLYKHLLLSSASEGRGVTFDNVILVAADANNKDHSRWVAEIRCRRRIYITINEDDRALQVSRMKSGEEQRARLGHYPFNLTSRHAAYVQFTDAARVENSHSYFEGKPLENPRVKRFFKRVFNGLRADEHLTFDVASNTYRI